ncbi:MAG: putative membrane protein [uncultured Sulfurovum sp.]|uniref:Putative membrane protein n=1 Tax=uncultured Sulfurovum sp. TaxID=269237 RepID=A0A6S6TMQ7_9BACT|nr:MAG: putative membrane protein [uncultured Sulfurovum sp.]
MKTFENDDLGKLILRLMIGGLMLFHGVAKLQNGVGFIEDKLLDHGLPTVIAYGIYIAEVVAPILIILGLKVRLSAFTIVFAMIGAIYLVHMNDIWTLSRGGAWGIEVQLMFLLGALAIMFLGSGKYVVQGKGS